MKRLGLRFCTKLPLAPALHLNPVTRLGPNRFLENSKIQSQFLNYTSQPFSTTSTNFKFELNQKKIRVLDIDINYVDVGKGDHVVVCLPGVFSSIELDFQPLINQFDKNEYRLIVWDPPGNGKSRPPNIRLFTPENLNDDATYLHEFMKKLGHEKYSVIAWSGGGMTASFFAVRYPSIIQKLVLWSSVAYMDDFTDEILKKLGSAGVGSLQPKRLQDLKDIYGDEVLDQMWTSWTTSKVPFQNAGFLPYGNHTKNIINRINCPTFIIHGLKDGFFSVEQAHYLNKNIRNSRIHLMPKGYHNLHVTCVEDFTNLVQNFLKQK